MKLSINYIIVIAAILAFLIGSYIPIYFKSIAYSVSLTIKEGIIFVIPFVIFTALFDMVERLKVGVIKVLTWFLVLMTVSNLFSITIANIIGNIVASEINLSEIPNIIHNENVLKPLWNIEMPFNIQNAYLILFSIVSALLVTFSNPRFAANMNQNLKKISLLILSKVIFPVIPLFVFGSVLKMQHDAILIPILKNYTVIFITILFSSWTYMMFVAAVITKKNFGKFIKSMLPAVISGFTTMSSAASLPVLTQSIKNFIKKDSIVSSLLPTACNFHLVGDCFIISIFGIVIFYTFFGSLPTFNEQLIFILNFVFMKYAFAGFPGAGVIVMMPVLKSALMFDSQMMSIIMTTYILFDPIGTATNLMGNGIFMVALKKFYDKMNLFL